MTRGNPQSQPAKSFRWLGSPGQECHPEGLINLLIRSGLRRLDADLVQVEVESLIGRLASGHPIGSRRLRSIKAVTNPDLKELRWKLNHPEQNSALRLYLVDEPLYYSGMRWHIKSLDQTSELLRLQQNLEISLSVIAFLENEGKNH